MPSSECIVCGSKENLPLFRTRDRHYGITGEFDIVICPSCGLVRIDPMPTEEELATYYSQSYYAYKPIPPDSLWTSFKQWLARSPIPNHDPDFEKPGDFLDIGCGSGTYLARMQKRGWRAQGVEPSAYGVENGRKSGLKISHGTLIEAGFADESFDYVRSNHSFEHMPNPKEVLREIHRILRPNGQVFIGIPNIDSIPYRIFGIFWWYMGAPVHTYTYSPSTITKLLTDTGFKVKKIYFNSNHASFIGSLQIYLNRNSTRRSDQGWVLRSKPLIIATNPLARICDLIHRGDAIEVICEKADG